MQFSPIIHQCIFQNQALGKKERKSRSLLHKRKQPQFLSQFSVIPLFSLLHPLKISCQLLFIREGSSINPGEHLIFFIASPVGSCQACKLNCLYISRIGKMRAGAQIHKIPLPVKTDYRILRQILYQCDLIILLFLFHQGKRFFPGKSKPLQLEAFLYNLLHFLFNRSKVIAGNRAAEIKIIIKPIINGRPDSQFGIRIQTFHRLRQYMGGCMPEHSGPFLFLKIQFSLHSILHNYFHYFVLLSPAMFLGLHPSRAPAKAH